MFTDLTKNAYDVDESSDFYQKQPFTYLVFLLYNRLCDTGHR